METGPPQALVWRWDWWDWAASGRLLDRAGAGWYPFAPMSDPRPSSIDWKKIERDPDFQSLVRRKVQLVVPATLFFTVYYFALPIAVGWFPELMERKVWGAMNLAYLFALSQFFMAWVLAGIYVAAAAGWDRKERALLAKFGHTPEH